MESHHPQKDSWSQHIRTYSTPRVLTAVTLVHGNDWLVDLQTSSVKKIQYEANSLGSSNPLLYDLNLWATGDEYL
jgi:hypothetical protein